MQELSRCFKKCKKEEDLVKCLSSAVKQSTYDNQLSPEDFDNYVGLLLANLRAGSYDGVTLFTELWNTYDKNLLIMASYLIPFYMKYLNTEHEMVLFAALSTIEDTDVVVPLACKIAETYTPEIKQWALFLKKLSGSDNEHIRYLLKIVNSLLTVSSKIELPKKDDPIPAILNKEISVNQEFVKKTISELKKTVLNILY